MPSSRVPSRLEGLRIDERVSTLRERLESRADTRKTAALRADVREARDHVKGWDEKKVSTTTAARYDRTVRQMRADGTRPEDARCKNTFEFRRAAVVHDARATVKSGLRDMDRAKRNGDRYAAATAYNSVRTALETLRQYPPGTGSREQDLTRKSAFSGPSRAERSNGKRGSISGLPADWRDRVQAELRDGDRAAVAVMSLSGARPAELRGVKVRQNDDTVAMTIGGAKFDAERGVKSRTLEFSRDELAQTQAGRDLSDWLGNRPVRTVAYEGSLSAFRERVARAADRADLQDVSGYSFRHAQARELKQAGTDRDEIARCLGHRSERSQSVYG
jgi:integrase